MAVLLTCGTGKTSVAIGRLMQEAKIPFLLGSRRGEAGAPSGMPAIKFDWTDSSTFKAPFEHSFPGGETITAVYLITPQVAEPALVMNPFIDFAVKEHGVKRFVLMAGTSIQPGGYYLGKVWQHLLDSKVEYCVLRPTWFMDNFSVDRHQFTIQAENKISSACGDGKVPFVSVADIAAVAFHALADKESHNTDHRVLGPELLTHDEIAEKLSTCLGRPITNVKLTSAERSHQMVSDVGLPEHYAQLLTSLEVSAADGGEDYMNDAVERVTGKRPQRFDAFAQEHRGIWQ